MLIVLIKHNIKLIKYKISIRVLIKIGENRKGKIKIRFA